MGSHRCYSFCCWVRFDLSQGIHFFEVVENRTEKFLRKEKEISTDISCHHDVLPIFSLNVLPRSNLKTKYQDKKGTVPVHGHGSKPLWSLSTSWSQLLRFLLVHLVAQRIKRLPAMREILVRSLGWEDPLDLPLE